MDEAENFEGRSRRNEGEILICLLLYFLGFLSRVVGAWSGVGVSEGHLRRRGWPKNHKKPFP